MFNNYLLYIINKYISYTLKLDSILFITSLGNILFGNGVTVFAVYPGNLQN